MAYRLSFYSAVSKRKSDSDFTQIGTYFFSMQKACGGNSPELYRSQVMPLRKQNLSVFLLCHPYKLILIFGGSLGARMAAVPRSNGGYSSVGRRWERKPKISMPVQKPVYFLNAFPWFPPAYTLFILSGQWLVMHSCNGSWCLSFLAS